MKTTGFIRMVDDLGRIIIPKEIRKSLGINECDRIEFFVDKENIVLKKYKKEMEESK